MRILIVQMQASSSPAAAPRFGQLLGVLAAVLKAEGHELELASFSRYQDGPLHEAVCGFRPEAIYIDADRYAADITRHVVEFIARNHGLPVVVGGLYPTAQPQEALSIPGVLAAAVGEPEVAVSRFFWALERGGDWERTAGMWVQSADGAVRNELAVLSDPLDNLPAAERELFRYGQVVQRTHRAEVSVGRGCPLNCGYCLNDWLTEICQGLGPWVRRRGPDNICDEIDGLCESYPSVERLTFVDHLFALDREWLEEFLSVYVSRCGLPFACHLRAGSVDAGLVELLAAGGCDRATVEIVSGSDFIRNEIFGMATSDRQIESACRMLRSAGIAVTAIGFVGSPYETDVTVERTAYLAERSEPARMLTSLFAPMPGTRAEELCREAGWLAGLGEKAYRANAPLIRMPAMPPPRIREAFEQFNWRVRHPRAAWLMSRLHRIRIGRRSLYDILVRKPIPNGRLLPADPRSFDVLETDGVMKP